MEVSKKILSIMRIIEAIPGYDRNTKLGYIASANKLLTDKDREVMTDVMKAMILLTAGNQKAVRDPKSYDPANARDPYGWLLGMGVEDIIKRFGLDIDLKSKPTREDYAIAHKLLPILGASSVSPEELGQYTDMGTRDPLDRYGSEGHQKVYRGITVSRNVILKATTKKMWNIGHGVSTSTSEKKGMEFAKTALSMWGANGGPALLLNIENKSKRGFHAGSMSRYPNEREVILSGVLQFGDWVLEAKASSSEDDIDLLIDSETQTVEFSRLVQSNGLKRELAHKMTFPNSSGDSFQEFVDRTIGGLEFDFPELPGDWEIREGTILLKMNAVLQ